MHTLARLPQGLSTCANPVAAGWRRPIHRLIWQGQTRTAPFSHPPGFWDTLFHAPPERGPFIMYTAGPTEKIRCGINSSVLCPNSCENAALSA